MKTTEHLPVASFVPILNVKRHIGGIDCLRGLAILLVFAYHGLDGASPFYLHFGAIRYLLLFTHFGIFGVHLFFILSGFLITTILLAQKKTAGYYGRFYTNRALRILPAYLLTIIAIKAFLGISWNFVLACFLFLMNMGSLVGAKPNEYGPLWSLAVEEQFYLVWPLLVRHLSPQFLLRLVVSLCVISPLARFVTATAHPNLDVTYKTWFVADFLGYGAMLSLAIHLGKLNQLNVLRIRRGLLLVGLPLCGLVICSTDLGRGDFNNFHKAFDALPFVAVFLALTISAIVWNSETRSTNVFKSVLEFYGYISYGLYLVHLIIFHFYDEWFPFSRNHVNSLILRALICLFLSSFVAFVSRRYFEEYFLRLKPKFNKKSASIG